MRLTDLNPRWVCSGGEGVTDTGGNPVPLRPMIAISFDCPCGDADCIRACIGFTNPPDGKGPCKSSGEHTWEMSGDSFADLTLTPSIQRVGECGWHGHVTAGEITTVDD